MGSAGDHAGGGASREGAWRGGGVGTSAYVSDVQRGARNPTVKVIWKLAEALETQPSVLLGIAEGVLGEG